MATFVYSWLQELCISGIEWEIPYSTLAGYYKHLIWSDYRGGYVTFNSVIISHELEKYKFNFPLG